ncbi:MAG: hypothetical protein AAB654_07880 [Acidobacteriota bacterium]
MENIWGDARHCFMTSTQARILAGFVTSVGVIGFVGLLVAGSFMPDEAELLRISAFVWFFAFGAARIALSHILAKRRRARGQRPANGSSKL